MISVILSPEVTSLLSNYTSAASDTETGGFLYGRMNPSWVYIGAISGPGPQAIQKKYGLQLDRNYILNYTTKMIENDYFVVGTWHTHPPFSGCQPSSTDIKTMQSFIKYGLPDIPYVFCIANQGMEKINFSFFSIYNINKIMKIENINIEVEDSNAR